MNFKEYPKTYEDVYTRYDVLKKCKLEHVSISDGMLVSEFKKFCESSLRETMISLFDNGLRYYWLQKRFQYMGYKKSKPFANYYPVDVGWAVFLRNHVGIDYRLFTRNASYRRIYTYFEEMFPEFNKRNPFLEPEYYKYPYKHVTLDFLSIVEQMPQRFDLLGIAEEKKMKWDEFIDYVYNWVLCHNDEIGRRVFTIVNTNPISPPYIRNNFSHRHRFPKDKSQNL